MNITAQDRLLVISPHPDDEALGCGGLIGKCLKEKAKTLILYIAVGQSRQLVTGNTEANSRQQEIKYVEKLLGTETRTVYVGAEFCRLDVVPQKDITEKIEDVIENWKPTIVTVPASSSYNQDHRAVWEASMTALRPVPKNLRHMPSLILEYYEPYLWSSREQKQPTVYLDLEQKYKKGNLLDFKIALYKCHKTQVREDPFPRSIENVIRYAHIYGKEIGVSIAEAYHLLRAEL